MILNQTLSDFVQNHLQNINTDLTIFYTNYKWYNNDEINIKYFIILF